MEIKENVPLAAHTTLKVGGPARYFCEARSEGTIAEAVAFAKHHKLPIFVLGGGSNVVVADRGWPGLVLKMAIQGWRKENVTPEKTTFAVGAGLDWDEFVSAAVAENCAGVECLSGIPGSVGGTPIQNVGAYGQEVSEIIITVRVYEIASGRILELNNRECGFSYRSSIFNSEQRGRYILLRVTFALKPNGRPKIQYADLKKFFANKSSSPSLKETRHAVREIRLGKAMLIVANDEDCRSVGSFFKNAIVTSEKAEEISDWAAQRHLELPRWPARGGQTKLSAAWLVEQAGFHKGYNQGAVGISRKHSLAIVNRGGATADDIKALKTKIQRSVWEMFGIELEQEPVFVGLDEQHSADRQNART